MTLDGPACITCGDVAVPLTVVGSGEDAHPGSELEGDVRCRADDGGLEMVATDLVGPVTVGDRLLVHAAVAIARLDPA